MFSLQPPRHIPTLPCVTSAVFVTVRNSTGDEGRPFEFGNQVLISSHRKLLWSKATVVNVCGKVGTRFPGPTRQSRRAANVNGRSASPPIASASARKAVSASGLSLVRSPIGAGPQRSSRPDASPNGDRPVGCGDASEIGAVRSGVIGRRAGLAGEK